MKVAERLRHQRAQTEPACTRKVYAYFKGQRNIAIRRLNGEKAFSVDDIFNDTEAQKELERTLQGFYDQMITGAVEATQELLDISFELPDYVQRAFLADAGANIPSITERTRTLLQRELDAANVAGEGIEQIARRIRDSSAFSLARSRVIARTELGHSSNAGAYYSYRTSGLVSHIHIFDGEEHPFCAAWNGRVIAIEMMADVPTLAHPNCVRAFGPIVGESVVEKPTSTEIPTPMPYNQPMQVQEISAKDIDKSQLDNWKRFEKQGVISGFHNEMKASHKAIAANLAADPEWESLALSLTKAKKLTPAIGEKAVAQLADAWGISSGKFPLVTQLQKAVKTEFGLEAAKTDHYDAKIVKEGEEKYGQFDAGLRAYARAQYSHTQEYLRSKGLTDDIYMARGMHFDKNPPAEFDFGAAGNKKVSSKKVEVVSQPLSSWTFSVDSAAKFSNNPVEAGSGKTPEYAAAIGNKVPIERIFALPFTGAGTMYEQEAILLGGKDEVMSMAWRPTSKTVNAQHFYRGLADGSK